jgi:hypothetical protein
MFNGSVGTAHAALLSVANAPHSGNIPVAGVDERRSTPGIVPRAAVWPAVQVQDMGAWTASGVAQT